MNFLLNLRLNWEGDIFQCVCVCVWYAAIAAKRSVDEEKYFCKYHYM